MAPALLTKLAAVALLLTVTIINAAPAAGTTDLIKRQKPLEVINGDFSQSLQGTWSYTNWESQPPNPFHRVKVNGNQVLQIEGQEQATCDQTPGYTHVVAFDGTINGLEGGKQYLFSYEYRFLESTTYYYLNAISVTKAYVGGARFTKKCRKNVWYSGSSKVCIRKSKDPRWTESPSTWNRRHVLMLVPFFSR